MPHLLSHPWGLREESGSRRGRTCKGPDGGYWTVVRHQWGCLPQSLKKLLSKERLQSVGRWQTDLDETVKGGTRRKILFFSAVLLPALPGKSTWASGGMLQWALRPNPEMCVSKRRDKFLNEWQDFYWHCDVQFWGLPQYHCFWSCTLHGLPVFAPFLPKGFSQVLTASPWGWWGEVLTRFPSCEGSAGDHKGSKKSKGRYCPYCCQRESPSLCPLLTRITGKRLKVRRWVLPPHRTTPPTGPAQGK